MDNAWTPERLELLFGLRGRGLSASQIGEAMGITRNAVLGKLHREGFSLNPSTVRETRSKVARIGALNSMPKRPLPPKPETPPDMPTPVAVGSAAVLSLRDGDCRFPIGLPGDPEFRFCCAPREKPHAYCAYHRSITNYEARHDKARRHHD